MNLFVEMARVFLSHAEATSERTMDFPSRKADLEALLTKHSLNTTGSSIDLLKRLVLADAMTQEQFMFFRSNARGKGAAAIKALTWWGLTAARGTLTVAPAATAVTHPDRLSEANVRTLTADCVPPSAWERHTNKMQSVRNWASSCACEKCAAEGHKLIWP
jgi:hypothetical protein